MQNNRGIDGMNILVIGNGFDLAHGLPTKYTDFLEFCKRVMATYNDSLTMDNSSFKHQFLDGWKIDSKSIQFSF